MGETTAIAWTQHTFNPYWGCTKISPGCDNCYAEAFDKRVFPSRGSVELMGLAREGKPDEPGPAKAMHWGKGAPRRTFGDAHWNEPLKWNRAAEKAGKPALVFCASMADWCDADAPPGTLERLHALWRATPWLRWQMLTKRPGRIARSLPPDWGNGYPNVWLGTTVENQEYAEQRIPLLLSVPAVVRFLSMEPLLGPVSLSLRDDELGASRNTLRMGISWVIVGGESGHRARPFNLSWARSIKDQCYEAGVPFFMKQLGAKAFLDDGEARVSLGTKDAKGGDMAEWPEDLRVQQFPPY